jgi:hypothetical protein
MPSQRDLETVRSVLERHRAEITSRFEAVGTGIGRAGDDYVITVYLGHTGHPPDGEVTVEGIRLQFEITGEFRPHSHR